MPHVKVNINGQRYTISGLTRATCSKQILCALAKVDAELKAGKVLTEKRKTESESENSANEGQRERPRYARESRRKLKNEDKHRTYKRGDGNAKYGKRHASRSTRSIKQITRLDSKGTQTSNPILATLGEEDETQNCALKDLDENELKDFEGCSKEVTERKIKDTDHGNGAEIASNGDNKESVVDDQAKETDHDTGISELHSDSSFDTNQILNCIEKKNIEKLSSVEKNLNCAPPIGVKCASTNTDPIETADAMDARMRRSKTVNSSVDDFIVAEMLGSETDVENDDKCTYSCVYVDSGCEELEVEIFKVRGDLKLTEAKLAGQNKMIESLDALINAHQTKAKDLFASNDDVTKRIEELKQSIKLSNQLYDYQRLETQANALELDRVESQLQRKRWHVESLFKQLCSVKKVVHVGGVQGRSVYYLRDGTLV